MKYFLFPLIPVLIAILAFPVQSLADEEAAELYIEYCSVCHGDDGDGRSRAIGSMIPPPRNFRTPEAAVELTRARMIESITEGREGTAMVAWKNQLKPAQIEAVTDYIRLTMMLPVANLGQDDGRTLYAENCSVCHGDDGQGAKWTLTNLKPPPKNFTSEVTAATLSRKKMIDAVTFGKADTAMPGFESQLGASQIERIVNYVRAAFMGHDGSESSLDNSSIVTTLANKKQPAIGNASRGEAFYRVNCVACHGENGDGKGPRAYFILPKPRNFTHPAARKTLSRDMLIRAIAMGTRGTDMPAWSKVLPEEDIMDIAEYVFQEFILEKTNQRSSAESG